DDLYVELTFVRSLEQHGLDVSIRQAGIDFANSTYPLWCANFNGRNCLRKGIAPPASSHPKYHASPDDIDYQIEADFSGIISPGLPNRAVKLGEQFGRIMNYGDGLYAGQFIGAMYAEAYFRGSRWWNEREEIVKEALKSIPAESKYAQMVRDVLSWHNGGYRAETAWHKVWEKAVEKYGRKDAPMLGKVSWHGIDVKINGAFLLIGYLWGEGDIEKTMKVATACGNDSDCNPANALGILGCQLGAKAFGPKYVGELDRGKTFASSPYKWDDLIAVSEKLARQIVVAEGGSIGRDEKGEYFLIPVQESKTSAFFDSLKPGPCGGERYTEEEMKRILYKPQDRSGSASEKK
ncbi:MAG: ADP-ribosylglycohydrolase family protein, partial [Kiritimatiellae bacterium]|nr:ADP-ribosylglycohydrolase family protein [Kiritimatiellia bacterium]